MARLSQPSDKQGLNVQILTIVLCIFPGWYYIIFPYQLGLVFFRERDVRSFLWSVVPPHFLSGAGFLHPPPPR